MQTRTFNVEVTEIRELGEEDPVAPEAFTATVAVQEDDLDAALALAAQAATPEIARRLGVDPMRLIRGTLAQINGDFARAMGAAIEAPVTITAHDPRAHEEPFLEWLQANGVDPLFTQKVVVIGARMVVFQYAKDEEGRKYVESGEAAMRDPFIVPIKVALPA